MEELIREEKLRKARLMQQKNKEIAMNASFKSKVEREFSELNIYITELVKNDSRFNISSEIDFAVAKDIVSIEVLLNVRFNDERLQQIKDDLKKSKFMLSEQGQSDVKNSLVAKVLSSLEQIEEQKINAYQSVISNLNLENNYKAEQERAWLAFSEYVLPTLNYVCSKKAEQDIIKAKQQALVDDRFSLQQKMFKSTKICITYIKLIENYFTIDLEKNDIKKFISVLCPRGDKDFYINRLKDVVKYTYAKYKQNKTNAVLNVDKGRYIKFRPGQISFYGLRTEDLINTEKNTHSPFEVQQRLFR